MTKLCPRFYPQSWQQNGRNCHTHFHLYLKCVTSVRSWNFPLPSFMWINKPLSEFWMQTETSGDIWPDGVVNGFRVNKNLVTYRCWNVPKETDETWCWTYKPIQKKWINPNKFSWHSISESSAPVSVCGVMIFSALVVCYPGCEVELNEQLI